MSEETIVKLVDQLSEMTVLDMSKLKKALEEKWDVKAAAGGPVMMASAPAADAPAAEEATDFQVVLESYPADKKIAIIKIVRAVTGLGLKEAKELVEAAPKAIKDSAPKSEAEDISKQVAEAGGKITLKGL